MGYKQALDKSWSALKRSGKNSVKFLNDEYEVDFSAKKIFSLTRNIEAKDYYKILILHYLANESNLPTIEKDRWISFKELEGGEIYFPAFRKRSIEPILRKYSDNPSGLYEKVDTFCGEKLDTGNAAISIRAFEKVKVGIVLWAKDEEFSADCNMLFNEGVRGLLPTEDVAVLGGIVASLV